jgi:hypothetical protein
MESYRPLRLIFFIYDLVRLIVMVSLLSAFFPPGNSGDDQVFPLLFYVVPNGLFPLMSLFLWIRLDAYKPYIALYMAGKVLAVVAVFAWLIFSLPTITHALSVNTRPSFTVVGTALLLTLGDALTILGGVVLKKKILTGEAAFPAEQPGVLLAETVQEAIVLVSRDRKISPEEGI